MISSPSQQEGGRYFQTDQATGRERKKSAVLDKDGISNASFILAIKVYYVFGDKFESQQAKYCEDQKGLGHESYQQIVTDVSVTHLCDDHI